MAVFIYLFYFITISQNISDQFKTLQLSLKCQVITQTSPCQSIKDWQSRIGISRTKEVLFRQSQVSAALVHLHSTLSKFVHLCGADVAFWWFHHKSHTSILLTCFWFYFWSAFLGNTHIQMGSNWKWVVVFSFQGWKLIWNSKMSWMHPGIRLTSRLLSLRFDFYSNLMLLLGNKTRCCVFLTWKWQAPALCSEQDWTGLSVLFSRYFTFPTEFLLEVSQEFSPKSL